MTQEEHAPSLLREHLLPFLDQDHRAVALLEPSGELIATNLAMIERLSQEEGLKRAMVTLLAAPTEQPWPEWVDELRRHGARAWWLALKPISATPEKTQGLMPAQEDQDEAV